MNRRKKINQILSSKAKKANARKNPGSKPRYIARADREKGAVDEPVNANSVEATSASTTVCAPE
jgi:hypothetical protein